MSVYNFGLITEWKNYPISLATMVCLGLGTSTNEYDFANLKESSKWELSPIERDNSKGGKTTVGYKLDISLNPVHSNVNDYIDSLMNNIDSIQTLGITLDGTESDILISLTSAHNLNNSIISKQENMIPEIEIKINAILNKSDVATIFSEI